MQTDHGALEETTCNGAGHTFFERRDGVWILLVGLRAGAHVREARIRPRVYPGQDGDTRVPVLINFSASSAISLTRFPERRSTVRPSRFHRSQTPSACQRLTCPDRPL